MNRNSRANLKNFTQMAKLFCGNFSSITFCEGNEVRIAPPISGLIQELFALGNVYFKI